jgi:hypothetical protein
MCLEGAKGLVSPETAAALDALLQLAIEKASETLMSGDLEPKDTVAAVKIIAEAGKAAAECVAKGNGIMRAPSAASSTAESSALHDPIYTFNDAVTAVCELDPETAYLEPWARVLSRINRLFQRVQKDVEEINGCRARTCTAPTPSSDNTTPRVGRTHQCGSSDHDDLTGVRRANQPGSGNDEKELAESSDFPEAITPTSSPSSPSGIKSGVKTPPTQSSDSPFMSQAAMNRLRSRAPT